MSQAEYFYDLQTDRREQLVNIAEMARQVSVGSLMADGSFTNEFLCIDRQSNVPTACQMIQASSPVEQIKNAPININSQRPKVENSLERPAARRSETTRSTLSNLGVLQKRAREEEPSRPCRAAKKSCSFSNFTHVRIFAEAEVVAHENDDIYQRFFFASWGDNVERVVPPANAAPIKSVRSGIIDFELETKKDDGLCAVSILDFELETKKNDGPDRVALLVKNLIDEFSSARHQQLKMLSLYAMSNIGVNSHPLPRTAEFANLAPKFSFSQLEPAVMNEAYARIQKLVFRVQQTGSVGLLPSASSINTSHLPVLNYLLLKLHRAAVAQLQSGRLTKICCNAPSSKFGLTAETMWKWVCK